MNRIWHEVNFSVDFDRLNLEFSFFLTDCHAKVQEHSLPDYLEKSGARIVECIHFRRA